MNKKDRWKRIEEIIKDTLMALYKHHKINSSSTTLIAEDLSSVLAKDVVFRDEIEVDKDKVFEGLERECFCCEDQDCDNPGGIAERKYCSGRIDMVLEDLDIITVKEEL